MIYFYNKCFQWKKKNELWFSVFIYESEFTIFFFCDQNRWLPGNFRHSISTLDEAKNNKIEYIINMLT